jgi:hypothetical protein
MAFRVAGAIGAVAVELSLGLLQDLRARFARALAMSVDVLAFRELDVDNLRVLAADGFRTLVIGAPLVADQPISSVKASNARQAASTGRGRNVA